MSPLDTPITFSGACNGTTAADTAFQAADAAAAAASTAVGVYCPTALASSYTMQAPLYFAPGGKIVLTGTNTLTLSAQPIYSGLQQIFSVGSGTLTLSAGPDQRWYPQWFGFVMDGNTHTGNAAALQAAINATAGAAELYMPVGSGCGMLDAAVSVNAGANVDGAGNHSGACVRAVANINAPFGLFSVGAGNNVKLQHFEIDGNNSNESGKTWDCVQTGYVTYLSLDLYIHNCPYDGAYTDGQHVRLLGDYNNNGFRGLVAGAGSSVTDDLYVDASTQGDAGGGYSCVGFCTHFQIHVRCQNADSSSTGSDCATGYDNLNNHGQWYVDCDTSGNHCLHIGGADQNFIVTCKSPVLTCAEIASKYVLTNGTVTTNGTTQIVGTGTTFTQCVHTCQNVQPIAVPQIVIGGSTYNIAYCTSDTNCYATATIPTATNAAYTLSYYGLTYNISGTVNCDTPGSTGAATQACLVLNGVIGGHFDGTGQNIPTTAYTALVFNSTAAEVDLTSTGGGSRVYMYGSTEQTTGTVSMTNGSTAVVGTGTSWLSTISAGDYFYDARDQTVYKVQSVTDNTDLVLTSSYTGTTVASTTYIAVWPNTYMRIGGSIIGGPLNGVQLLDTIFSEITTTSSVNGGYGYAEGGISGYTGGSNCYHGMAYGNTSGSHSIKTGSAYGTCP